jgi:hypothetical protein
MNFLEKRNFIVFLFTTQIFSTKTELNEHIDEWVIHIDGDISSAQQFADSHDLVFIANVYFSKNYFYYLYS